MSDVLPMEASAPLDSEEWLHIYAQSRWHGNAYIAGTRAGLLVLRAAIDAALDVGAGQADAFVNDGEGYTMCVNLVDGDTMMKLAVPYDDELAQEATESTALWPSQLPSA